MGTSLLVMVLVLLFAQVTAAQHARTNVQDHVRAVVAMIVLVVVKTDVLQAARRLAKTNVKINVPNHALIVVITIVHLDVLQFVQTHVRLKLHNTALIVPATVLLDVLLPVQTLARHKHLKDVMDVAILVVQDVADNAIGLVVALVINSVKVLV